MNKDIQQYQQDLFERAEMDPLIAYLETRDQVGTPVPYIAPETPEPVVTLPMKRVMVMGSFIAFCYGTIHVVMSGALNAVAAFAGYAIAGVAVVSGGIWLLRAACTAPVENTGCGNGCGNVDVNVKVEVNVKK